MLMRTNSKNHQGHEEHEGGVRFETSRLSSVNSQFFVIFVSFVVQILFVFPRFSTHTW